jgi:8-oxo-dGTP pyrophosphatase MutT (NUDIX family)
MEVISRKTLWEGRFINTELIYYRDRKGSVHEWEAVRRVNCDGIVIIVPLTVNEEVLLIRQFRPALNSYVIELPAGLIDTGEDALAAGKRELLEETGHSSDNFVLLTEGVMSTGLDTDKWNIVLARDLHEAKDEIRREYPPDESEDIETIRVPLKSVYNTIEAYSNKGDEIDLRIFGLLELAKRTMGSGTHSSK